MSLTWDGNCVVREINESVNEWPVREVVHVLFIRALQKFVV